MTNYEVDYSYKIVEYGTNVVEADDKEVAEQLTIDYVRDTFDQVFDITIDTVREVNR